MWNGFTGNGTKSAINDSIYVNVKQFMKQEEKEEEAEEERPIVNKEEHLYEEPKLIHATSDVNKPNSLFLHKRISRSLSVPMTQQWPKINNGYLHMDKYDVGLNNNNNNNTNFIKRRIPYVRSNLQCIREDELGVYMYIYIPFL